MLVNKLYLLLIVIVVILLCKNTIEGFKASINMMVLIVTVCFEPESEIIVN